MANLTYKLIDNTKLPFLERVVCLLGPQVYFLVHIFLIHPLAAAAGASGGAAFEAIYDSIKMKKSSFYFNQFKDMQARKLKSENLRLERELGGLTLVLPRSIC